MTSLLSKYGFIRRQEAHWFFIPKRFISFLFSRSNRF